MSPTMSTTTSSSSCERLFFALSAILNHRLFGGDACNAYAYAHSPAGMSAISYTFVSIDDQFRGMVL